MQVSSSSITVIDFGNALNNVVHYDFFVGLWNGTQLTKADAMSQLKFTDYNGSTTFTTANISYLGNNLFRFTETSPSSVSGTSLVVSSALEGSFVRSLGIVAFGNDTGGAFSNDFVDIAATRTLTAVPEADTISMMAAGLMVVGLLGRRRMRGGSRA